MLYNSSNTALNQTTNLDNFQILISFNIISHLSIPKLINAFYKTKSPEEISGTFKFFH